MSSSSGPNGVANGLVFCVDAGTIKNQTVFSSNFYTNSAFGDGSGMPYESGSNPTNEVIAFPNPGDSAFVLRQTGTVAYTEYQINLTSQLVASTTYCLSGWYAESSDYSCADGSRMFHCRAHSSSGAHDALGIGIGTVLKTVVVNGITWKYCYDLITTPSDYNNDFAWFVGYGGSAYTGYRYYTNLKMERGTFPSMLDLSRAGNHGSCINGITYDASNGGSLVFDGTNDHISLPSINLQQNFTLECWAYITGDGSSIFGQGITAANQGLHILWNAYNSRGMIFGMYANDLDTPSYNLSLNTWHQFVFTYNHSTYLKQFYADGVLINSGTGSAYSGSGQFYIGSIYGSPVHGFAKGKISKALGYNRVLTAQEVAQNFQASRGRYGI